jgi:primary-amine oxidase
MESRHRGKSQTTGMEDFPVMPCEFTGVTLKPDGFFSGNPAIDLPPVTNEKNKMNTS